MEENSKPDQEGPESEDDRLNENRRGGIDRRWIKSGYKGRDRRRMPDGRREEAPPKDSDFDSSRL